MIRVDTTLEIAAVDALSQSPHIAGADVECYAQCGHVTLRGVVPSFFHKQMAQEAVRHVEGVERIENEIQVAW